MLDLQARKRELKRVWTSQLQVEAPYHTFSSEQSSATSSATSNLHTVCQNLAVIRRRLWNSRCLPFWAGPLQSRSIRN
jgi:hypothetical protein